MRHWENALPIPMISIALTDWVRDFDATLARLLDFLDLPPDPACQRFYEFDRRVGTASRDQVRRPINAAGIGRWQDYEARAPAADRRTGRSRAAAIRVAGCLIRPTARPKAPVWVVPCPVRLGVGICYEGGMTSETTKTGETPRALADLRRAHGEPLPLAGAAAAVPICCGRAGRGLHRTWPGGRRSTTWRRRLVQAPMGYAVDRFGPRRMLISGLCLSGIAFGSIARVPGLCLADRRRGARRHRQLGLPPVGLLDPRLGDRAVARRPGLLGPHLRRASWAVRSHPP